MSCDDKRTIILKQTLEKSGDTVDKFEKIIEECKNNKKKYVDPDFYPQKTIIDEDKVCLEDHVWKRIEDQYPNLFENISPNGVRQGKLGDCYFVASLIYAAHNKEFVKYLFHPKSSLEYGCALIYFHFLGERIPIIIDTQIPYPSPDSEYVSTEPSFSKPRTNDDSCWFVLVEKAFAKACGGYYMIESGQTHFGNRVLLDQFPVALGKIEEIVPEATLTQKNIDLNGEIFKELQKLIQKNAMIGTAVSLKSFPNTTAEELEKATGLITEHAYQVLDIREVQKKRFLKVRNPWGKFEWTGAYSNGSKEWTSKLKKELDYSQTDDGSFWMTNEDFLTYFKSANYSLPKEKGWKEHNVYGKIDGYLDGRTPCTDTRNIGCIPQWSIKFTKKTVVRLSYDVAGPPTYHGLYICKAHGRKIDSLDKDVEIMRTTTNTTTNGIEYVVNDFSEPFTFFLDRNDFEKYPCYYRILIESPDTKFKVEKFDDNFIKEKWNCVSDQNIFTSPTNDNWNPFGGLSLATCRQWYVNFPDMKKDEEVELRIQLFKNVTDCPLEIFFGKTDKKMSHAYSSLEYIHIKAYACSDYEEYPLFIKDKKDDENGNKWMFCIFRRNSKEVSQFKFCIWCRQKMQFGMMPEPDPLKNCGYTITGKLSAGKKDGLSPFENGVKDLKQYCLVFKKSPTIVFVEFTQKNAASDHAVYLEMRDNPGDKIDVFYRGTTHFDFDVSKDCARDMAMWKIDDISKPYALCVTREAAKSASEYEVNVFGDSEFEMKEITSDGKLGKLAPKYKPKSDSKSQAKPMNFPQIKPIEQPANYAPKKAEAPKQNKQQNASSQKKTDQGKKEQESVVKVQNETGKKQEQEQQRQAQGEEKKEEPAKSSSKCCLLI